MRRDKEALYFLVDHNVPLVAFKPGSKSGLTSDYLDRPVLGREALDAYFREYGELNWGVLTDKNADGSVVEVEAESRDAAIALAEIGLPYTPVTSRRDSLGTFRYVFRVDYVGKSFGEAGVIELHTDRRGCIVYGTHPSGEKYNLEVSGDEIPTVSGERLIRRTRMAIAAVLISRVWEPEARSNMAGALSGAMARWGYELDDIKSLIRVVATLSDDEELENRVGFAVRSWEKWENDEDVTGWSTFVELAGGETPLIRAIYKHLAGSKRDRPVTATRAQYSLTDMGNADRFVAQHLGEVLFIPERRKFAIWTGEYWEIDEAYAIYNRAVQTVRSIYNEVAAAPNREDRERIAGWAVASEHWSRLDALVKIARSDPRLSAPLEQFDANPWLFNAANGTIDLRTGDLRGFDPDDFMTTKCDVPFRLDAECPLWEETVFRAMNGDEALVDFLQRSLGYTLYGRASEKAVFVCWGDTSRGKTTVLSTVQSVLGNYAAETREETISSNRRESVPVGHARLRGKRMSLVSEPGRDLVLNVSFLKNATGGNRQVARFMRENEFEFDPSAKFWIDTNHKPRIPDDDDAIWSRVKLIPFTRKMPSSPGDPGYVPDFRDRLEREYPGILRWLVEGCLKWQERGLEEPQAVRRATVEYRGEEDEFGDFIESNFIIDENESTPIAKVWARYQEWSHGDRNRLGKQQFNRALEERGFERKPVKIDGKAVKCWVGFALTRAASDDAVDQLANGSWANRANE